VGAVAAVSVAAVQVQMVRVGAKLVPLANVPFANRDSDSRLARAPGWAQRHLRLAAARPGLAEGGRTGGGT
jgi:hypothetical protein